VPSLLLATTNRGKLREIVPLLAGLPFEIKTLADVDSLDPPEETGQTFGENARQKARYYAAHTGCLTVAEDSGLEIDALGGIPGVHSARYGGADSSYPEKFARIYQALKDAGADGSRARFVCAVAVVLGSRVVCETEGTIEGEIAIEPKGTGGFGYDPIFYYPPFGTTLAEAGDRKSLVSHRARAFTRLRGLLSAQPSDAFNRA
jgi:XTP/dITP diphosphohydrolase